MASQSSVCPVGLAGVFETGLRRLIHHPKRLLAPWVGEGSRVLDVGCGPGFFTVELAHLVGPSGEVVAVDLQQGMLDRAAARLAAAELAGRVQLRRCAADDLGVSGHFDFVLLFYVVHEIDDPARFFRHLRGLVATDATVLLVEPPLHVSTAQFSAECVAAEAADFAVQQRLSRFPDQAVLLVPISSG